MKTFARVLFILLIGFACKKEEPKKSVPAEVQTQPNTTPNYPPFNHVQLLKVDYLTYDFEGGADIWLSAIVPGAETMPVKVTYKAPGDFGSVLLQIEPTADSLFSGGIIWMGKGEIDFPKNFNPDSVFARTSGGNQHKASDYIPIALYQGHEPPVPDLAKMWNAIGNLKLVSDHKALGKKFQVLLYTPSVGVGDPADWDWIVLLSL